MGREVCDGIAFGLQAFAEAFLELCFTRNFYTGHPFALAFRSISYVNKRSANSPLDYWQSTPIKISLWHAVEHSQKSAVYIAAGAQRAGQKIEQKYGPTLLNIVTKDSY